MYFVFGRLAVLSHCEIEVRVAGPFGEGRTLGQGKARFSETAMDQSGTRPR